MIIPFQQLNEDTLQNLIEQFVLKEGTDYGEQEFSLAEKVDHVKHQLASGEAVIVFSEEYQTADIRLASDYHSG